MITALSHPLIDILVFTPPEFLHEHNLIPGSYGIIDNSEQDILLGACKSFPQTLAVGGSAANSAITAQTLGVQSAMLGLVGDDALGRQVYQMLQTRGVRTPLSFVPEKHTGTCISFITPDGERTMRTNLAVVKELDPSHICEKTLNSSAWLLVEGYFLTASEANTEAMHRALAVARARRVKVAFTASAEFVIGAKREEILHSILPVTDLLLANEGEAKLLSHCTDPREALSKLSQLCPSVVITRGNQGAIGAHSGVIWQTAAFTPEQPIIDTTGAGDVFAGAFLAGLTQNYPPSAAARGAARLASIVITQYGAHLPHEAHLPWLEDMKTPKD